VEPKHFSTFEKGGAKTFFPPFLNLQKAGQKLVQKCIIDLAPPFPKVEKAGQKLVQKCIIDLAPPFSKVEKGGNK